MDKHTKLLLSPLIYIFTFMLVVYIGVNLPMNKPTYSASIGDACCIGGQYVNGNCLITKTSSSDDSSSGWTCQPNSFNSCCLREYIDDDGNTAEEIHATIANQCPSGEKTLPIENCGAQQYNCQMYDNSRLGVINASGSCVKAGTATGSGYRVCFKDAAGYISDCDRYGCDIGADGKVVSDCPVDTLYSVCSRWSPTKWDEVEGSGNQGAGLSQSEFVNHVFTGNATYYCVAGTSIHPSDSDPEPTPTNTCSNLYLSTASACKQTASKKCGSAGYTGCTTKDSNNCYTYTCKTTPSTPQTKISCYVCNVDGSDFPIKATSTADATTKTGGVNCKEQPDMTKCDDPPTIITNPGTGNVAIIFVWIIGIMTFGYAIWYFKKVSSIN